MAATYYRINPIYDWLDRSYWRCNPSTVQYYIYTYYRWQLGIRTPHRSPIETASLRHQQHAIYAISNNINNAYNALLVPMRAPHHVGINALRALTTSMRCSHWQHQCVARIGGINVLLALTASIRIIILTPFKAGSAGAIGGAIPPQSNTTYICFFR